MKATSLSEADRSRAVRCHGLLIHVFRWWEGKRPAQWTLDDHLKNPRIHCTPGREADLACEIAQYVTTYGRPDLAVWP